MLSMCRPQRAKRARNPGENEPLTNPPNDATLLSLKVVHIRTRLPNSLRSGRARR